MDGDVSKILWAYLRENCLPFDVEAEYGDADNLFEAGILDSAGVLAFVGFIEKVFDLTIPDEDLLPENFTSIRATTQYINSRLTKESLDKFLRPQDG